MNWTHFLRQKNTILGIGIALLLVCGFVWRDRVSHWLSFGGQYPSPIVSETPFASPSSEPSSTPSQSPTPRVIHVTPPPLPLYKGRSPEEVRPVPDEVKLFSEEQKKKIYGDIDNYGKAVKENPDYFAGWLQLGLLKKVIGDFEGARDAWEYASLIRPSNNISFANLGELYWRYLPDFPKAEANLKIAIKNKPEDTSAYITLSGVYYYSYKEKSGLADDILFEGLKVNPESTDLMSQIALYYERIKDYPKAIEWWQKMLEKMPDNQDIKDRIESLKQK